MKGTVSSETNALVAHALWYAQTVPIAKYSQNKVALEFIGMF